MEKDKIFFGEQGLTTTSANYIANLAKESYQSLERELALAKFYSLEVGLLGSNDTKSLRQGVDEDFVKSIADKLNTIARYKSLIAWLREAIKAKDRLIKEAQNLSFKEMCAILKLTPPEEPETYPRMTSEDVIASWNIKQRNRYYYLDTVCSVIGSYIHPDGTYAVQREALHKVLMESHEVKGEGRDMVIYTKTPSVSPTLVEDTFFNLQAKYREYQAELNSMKHSIETALQEDERQKSLKEKEEYSRYKTEYNEVLAMTKCYHMEAIASAQALKIVVPDSLKSDLNSLNKVGK